MSRHSFFVVGCHRSGTTSLARILDQATNGVCLVEPAPNLNREARDRMDGRLADPLGTVREAVAPRVKACEQEVYGEKNAPLGYFVRELVQLFDCKLIVMVRDGRDVVRSLMNWHNDLFGTIYRECADAGDLNETAREALARLPIELDHSDYFRPRPHPGEPLHAAWLSLSRFEMCAFFWARYNEFMLDQLNGVPEDRVLRIDYTGPDADRVLEAARFVGLSGLDRERVAGMLAQRINSLDERTGRAGRFPHWSDWSDAQQRQFDAIAGPMMDRLGYTQQ